MWWQPCRTNFPDAARARQRGATVIDGERGRGWRRGRQPSCIERTRRRLLRPCGSATTPRQVETQTVQRLPAMARTTARGQVLPEYVRGRCEEGGKEYKGETCRSAGGGGNPCEALSSPSPSWMHCMFPASRAARHTDTLACSQHNPILFHQWARPWIPPAERGWGKAGPGKKQRKGRTPR